MNDFFISDDKILDIRRSISHNKAHIRDETSARMIEKEDRLAEITL